MMDARRLLDQFLGTGVGEGAAPDAGTAGSPGGHQGEKGFGLGGMAGAAAAGGLIGLLLGTKKGRKVGRGAVKYGGVALMGGLAYKAWNDWQAGRSPETVVSRDPGVPAAVAQIPTPPADTPFLPPESDVAATEDLSSVLLRSMIAACAADGHITSSEQRRIFAQLNLINLGDAEKSFVENEIARPIPMSDIVAQATTPERATEIYVASLLALDSHGLAERSYLATLASQLKLDSDLVRHLHANVTALAEAPAP
jgi:uncharacterized membrane protein YebE (DUF533 family)